ncbi:MAG: alpha/beta fold hydrolase, partial [Limisphaerales bacterium]
MQLHYRTYGDGPPLIILHGLFGSLDNWHSISSKLAERFRVLAVDQRNHGRSPHSDQMSYEVMAADVSGLLEHEKIPCAHIMGHSMGGKTAMQMALLFPQQVESLIVVDIAPKIYPPIHHKIIEALGGLDLARFQSRKEMEEALAAAIPELSLRQFLLKNARRKADGSFEWQIGLDEIRRG